MLIEPITPIDSQLEGMIKMTQFSTAEVAEKLDTTPRTLRKFLRADAKANGTADSLPGKGSRYAIEGKEVAPLKRRFKVWQAAEAEARKVRAEKAAAEAQDAVEVDETDAEVEPGGPTPEELAAEEDISVDS